MPDKSKPFVESFAAKTGPIDVESREVRFLASTENTDRDNERIMPEAFRPHLDTFMTNPVFLAGHQHRLASGEPSVIGKVVKIWIDQQGLWAIVQFAETEVAATYWRLYRDGFMKAVSVSFIPIKWHDVVENGKHIRVYDEVELIEISAVAVPSNRQALARSKQNKLAFVQGKREQKEEDRFLAEIRAEYKAMGRDWDAEYAEFCELLLGGDDLSGKEVPDEKCEPDYGRKFKKRQA